MSTIDISFTAPPTVAMFMSSTAFFRVILGPVGSGKTTGCLFELFRRAAEQAPGEDGIRRTRFAIVRETLKQLKDTVLKDITGWLQGIAHYKVSEGTIHVRCGDIVSEWVMIPLDDPADQARLLSMQLTGAWMSECIEMNSDLVAAISGRCGRYPSGKLGKPTWFGIIADTNFPSEGSTWHKLFEMETPPDWQIFKQPGGMELNAENIENLPGGREYYERLERTPNPDWVRRYVHAQYGTDPSGSAVFRESFRRAWHVAPEVLPVRGHPLIIGQDFGRDPCSIICQLDHTGRMLVLEEVMAEDMGLELHLTRGLRPALVQERYLGIPVVVVGDPAGMQRSTTYEETSFDVIKRHGLQSYPAPTNDIDPRLRAVEAFLLGSRNAGPAVLIDGTRCPNLVLALGGGYRYAKMKSGQLKPMPDKNKFSHISDAFQYAATAIHGGMSGMFSAQLFRPQAPKRQKFTANAWT